MAAATLATIDIRGFAEHVAGKSPDQVASYLQEFYALVFRHANLLGFEIVKCMGDAVLLKAPESADKLRNLYTEVAARYPVELAYRSCEYAPATIRLGEYSCHDVFGHDVNALFGKDEATTVLS